MENARSRRSRGAVFVMGTMAVAGVLIWSKLRLATNIPRSAYAVPEDRSVEPGSGGDGVDHASEPTTDPSDVSGRNGD